MNRNFWAATLATIVVVVVVVLGFRVQGGPANQRMIRADQRTLQVLAQLAQQVNSKWQSGGKTLPGNLNEFPESAKKNPASGALFTYRVKSPSEYELCSTFLTDNRNTPEVNTAGPWLHPKGEHCFSFDSNQLVSVPYYYFY